MKVLVTGCAGFIAANLIARLLEKHEVVGIDIVRSNARLSHLRATFGFESRIMDVNSASLQADIGGDFDCVVHLAALTGVRAGWADPHKYVLANVTGTLSILEYCRLTATPLIMASSSSVYGSNREVPGPESLYAATKVSGEALAQAYASGYGMRVTALRFFTVYGPWGRPDMALSLFANAMLDGRAIEVFNFGDHRRDMTYIDDVTESLRRLIEQQPTGFDVLDVGTGEQVSVLEMIDLLENALEVCVEKIMLPRQRGDVSETLADWGPLQRATAFRPTTPLRHGVPRFLIWLREQRSA